MTELHFLRQMLDVLPGVCPFSEELVSVLGECEELRPQVLLVLEDEPVSDAMNVERLALNRCQFGLRRRCRRWLGLV